MAKELGQFTLARNGKDYRLTIEDAEGETSEFTLDFDQLESISEAVDEALNSDEEEEEADDDDEEEDDD